jgi:hypothetical protein
LDITNFFSSLTTRLSNLLRPKCLPILVLIGLHHHPQLGFMPQEPNHHFSQLIVLNLQAIHIMCKFQILQSMYFTCRARSGNWFFQLSLK